MQFDGCSLKILLIFHHSNQAASTTTAGSGVLTTDGHVVLKVHSGLVIGVATAKEEEADAKVALLDECGTVAEEGDELGGKFVTKKGVEDGGVYVIRVGIKFEADRIVTNQFGRC